ncbi:PLP-dependent lyase/thiolase [Vallitalea pronyensis]|uniref:PLP-dependent lyase/thiolase n=1 Tax=Vallitalea pronyensis TaxID=1348613 RepID=A0A8J8SHX1_9FIRM|nr:2-amino-4-oxopentanoate thiolase subunit OrtB [Vallitalea pronyensis]QUI24011.1 PLP-dependent lyase/thiolase [Vallitalea pronyensis]
MNRDNSYAGVMARKNQIMKHAVGMDYAEFEKDGIVFDYEEMMRKTGYSLDQVRAIERNGNVGETPIYALKNLTKLARIIGGKGKGARIFLKDEAANPSGSFKARRAAVSVYHAKKLGYKGVIAATSGNYGAAVASQAAMQGLKCIIIQECYDSEEKGQPEIIEKARKCEAYGAEVIQLTVGPELFYTFLKTLEDTGYFNASLYTPFGIAGVETLGYEIATWFREHESRDPDMVIVTNAGGGNLTGTARGLLKAGAKDTTIVGASVDLKGLHMASDGQFNRKSFTTGHTGFGVPFATNPDRSDVPRSAARPLRYMDRYVTVSQGEVFYMTEALAMVEGLERGPAGNTAITAAFCLASQMDDDQMIVVQETEYTGAGKHVAAQLTFAKENGIRVERGNPIDQIPGKNIILPEHPSLIQVKELEMDRLRKSYLKHVWKETFTDEEIKYIAAETKMTIETVHNMIHALQQEGGV